jgi:hypothetical protein
VICEYSGSLVGEADFNKRLSMYQESPDLFPLSEYDVGQSGKVWDAFTVSDGNVTRQINIEDNKGAWINSTVNGINPNPNSIFADLNNRPENCKIHSILHSGVLRLYVLATRNIPRSYEVIQNYNNNLLISGYDGYLSVP